MHKYGFLYEINLGILLITNGADGAERERSWEWGQHTLLGVMDELSKEGWEVVCASSKTPADESYIVRKSLREDETN